MATFDERFTGEDLPPAPASRWVGARGSHKNAALEQGLKDRARRLLTLGQMTERQYQEFVKQLQPTPRRSASFDDRFSGLERNDPHGHLRAWPVHMKPRRT